MAGRKIPLYISPLPASRLTSSLSIGMLVVGGGGVVIVALMCVPKGCNRQVKRQRECKSTTGIKLPSRCQNTLLILGEVLGLEAVGCKRILAEVVVLLRLVVVQVAHAFLTHQRTHTVTHSKVGRTVDPVRLRHVDRSLSRVRVLGQRALAAIVVMIRLALAPTTVRSLREILSKGCLRSQSQLRVVAIARRAARVIRGVLVVHPAS
ncbi:hypothetical protein BKA57DRAFT_220081 [Linnemannia elongata]|nr:hypothetical protein BKA57DRAFT_220081 [Linnemannia elongata]